MASTPMTARDFELLVSSERSDLQQIVEAWSAAAQWTMTVAASSEVKRKVRQQRYDVVLLGLQGSVQPAFDLLEFLRDSKGSERVIILTDTGSEAHVIELLRGGAKDLLRAPFKPEEVTAMLDRAKVEIEESAFLEGLYRNVHTEITEFLISSNQLGNSLLPLTLIERLQQSGVIDRMSRHKIAVAFQEALTNAHLHGNLELESAWKEEFNEEGIDKFTLIKNARLADTTYGDRKIAVQIHYEESTLSITIRDEGKGFPQSLRAVPLADAVLDPLILTGRGFSLMRWGMDEILFNEKGNEVTLLKRIGDR